MGDWESKNYDDAAVPQDAHAMDRAQEYYDKLNREIQRAEEEMLRRAQREFDAAAQRPMPPDDIFRLHPGAYDEWRRGQQKPSAAQIDPKLLDRLRQNMGSFPMPKPGHVKVKMIGGGGKSNGTNPGPPFIDEAHDIFSEVYLGDYPHMEPMTRKQEVCRHHPVNVGFNTDKWVCKICDKDLDTPVDNSYK